MNTIKAFAVIATLSVAAGALGQVPSIINYQGRLSVGGSNVFQGNGRFKFALVNGARQATAAGTVSGGFLTVVNITDRGAGYNEPPEVTVTDATGSGAVLTASISGGIVTGVAIGNPGHNYSANPTVTIAPPSTYVSATFWSNDGSSTGGTEPVRFVPLVVNQGLFSVSLGDLTITNMTTVIRPDIFTNSDVRIRIWFSDGVSGFQQFYPDQRLTSVGYAMMAGNVADSAVTSAKLAPGAVGTSALASNAINSLNIADSAITTGKLADAVITAEKLAPNLFSTFPIYPNGITAFTSSGTWTNPPGVSRVYVKLWGGGGGFQNGSGSSAAYGGAGAYCEGVVTVTSNVQVTVGAAGESGSDFVGTSATDGGASSFLSLFAGGGLKARSGQGGGGGSASGGAINVSGQSGGIPYNGASSPRTGAAPGIQPADGFPGGASAGGMVIIYY